MTRIIENTQHEARHPWPERIEIQGGDHGVVFSGEGNYRTAFFEAFPPGTFLRGEGKTIQEAEDNCWTQFQRYLNCDGSRSLPGQHGPYERRQYRNGSGFCTRCGIWMNRVLPELPKEPDDRPRTLAERIFVDKDKNAIMQALETWACVDELPEKPGN
ncbi:hypothetical protein [Streptomyces sp. 5-10]|uniref:hypothetical protein n=1 Tax=Streptomyces sp. 5-10 TaxID=878925 RepID=UPI00168B7B13|nr:hypothetical protein [Streptomyces sp. 5-10]MBD3004816.1 hypothetical protein [Streptomyces sp. 5-10]